MMCEETVEKKNTHTPVLDVFPNNKKIGLDESLDDLTVPLLPSRQLPGHWNRLEMRKQQIRFINKNHCGLENATTNNNTRKKFNRTSCSGELCNIAVAIFAQ